MRLVASGPLLTGTLHSPGGITQQLRVYLTAALEPWRIELESGGRISAMTHDEGQPAGSLADVLAFVERIELNVDDSVFTWDDPAAVAALAAVGAGGAGEGA